MICRPAAADMTSTYDFDLGDITVCRATLILFWFGDSDTENMSFETPGRAIIYDLVFHRFEVNRVEIFWRWI